MKIAILGDTHFSARGASKVFSIHMEKFYTETFFPYLRENNIKRIIQCGDLFDERPQIKLQAFEDCKRYFFDELVASKISMTVLIGNHDCPYKQTIKLNAPKLLLQEYFKNITVIDRPQELHYDGLDVTLIPWICKDNQEECLNLLNSTKASVVVGHFDIQGFEMFKNSIPSSKGLSQKLFERFELVLSGHFHTRSKQGNILYVGTPVELCWADYNDPKGFHVLDTETLELEFIENPIKIHQKHVFKSGEKPPQDCAAKYLKLFIEGSYDPVELDKWVTNIDEQGPADFKKIETSLTIEDVMEESGHIDNIENYSILDIAKENIQNEAVSDLFKDLYMEALSLNDSF